MNIAKRNKLFNILLTSFSILFAFGSSLMMTRTLDSKLSNWCNKFNDYYYSNTITEGQSPILRLNSDNKRTFQDIFDAYYYCNSGTVNKALRQFYNGKSSLISRDETHYSTYIGKQSAFSIGLKYDWGYYLDYGLFATYYKDEYLPNRGYLERRFNADGFCFISDTLANKLVDEYGLSESQNPYKELILNEQYALLGLSIDGQDTDVKLCINNILYSTSRDAPRVQSLYGDFCLVYGDKITMNELNYTIEFDLKTDIYGNKLLLKSLNLMGYNPNNTHYSVLKYNAISKKYMNDANLDKQLAEIDFHQNDFVYYFVPSLIILFIFSVYVFCFIKKISIVPASMLTILLLTLFFLIMHFIYAPPLFNLFEIILYVACIINLSISIILRKKSKKIKAVVDYEISI